MRINVEATKSDFEPALLWLAGQVGGPLKQRVRNFERHTKGNPMLAAHFRNIYPLEYALVDACTYRRNTGRVPNRRRLRRALQLRDSRNAHLSAVARERSKAFRGEAAGFCEWHLRLTSLRL